jgi:hypothetical protein
MTPLDLGGNVPEPENFDDQSSGSSSKSGDDGEESQENTNGSKTEKDLKKAHQVQE